VAFSGLSETALWDLIRGGKITSGIPAGTRRRLISRSSLVAWLDANTAWDEGTH